MKIKHSEPYNIRRIAEYPKVSDQLDAIYKMAVALKEQGFAMPPDTLVWINEVSTVKSKFKKNKLE